MDLSRNCTNFLVPPIISGMGKAVKFKFSTHIHRIDRNKNSLKISTLVAVGVLRDYRKIFRAPIYRAHRAVIFAVGQLYCSPIVLHAVSTIG